MILPAIAPFRWPARLALFGFAGATIAGWLLFGARFQLAYIDKAIELALLCFLAIEVVAVRRRAGRRRAPGAAPGRAGWPERSRHGAPDEQATACARPSGGAVLASLVAACSTASGSRVGPPRSAPAGGAVTVAQGVAFDRTQVDVPAEVTFPLLFENCTASLATARSSMPEASAMFVGEAFTVRYGSRTYVAPALRAGTYRYRCDAHTAHDGDRARGDRPSRGPGPRKDRLPADLLAEPRIAPLGRSRAPCGTRPGTCAR